MRIVRECPVGQIGKITESGRVVIRSGGKSVIDVPIAEAFRLVADEQTPYAARPLVQAHGARLLLVNPPALPLSEAELDQLYALPFRKFPHPAYRDPIPACEQTRFRITSYNVCYTKLLRKA